MRLLRRAHRVTESDDGRFYLATDRRAAGLLWASWVAMERAAIRAAAGI